MKIDEDQALQEIHSRCFIGGVDTFVSAQFRRVSFRHIDNIPFQRELVKQSGLYNDGFHVYVPLKATNPEVLRAAFENPKRLPDLVAQGSFCYAFLNEADCGQWVLDVNCDAEYFGDIVNYTGTRVESVFRDY